MEKSEGENWKKRVVSGVVIEEDADDVERTKEQE